jgi:predicted  nucleic acid-binding Zn-ribbon protein
MNSDLQNLIELEKVDRETARLSDEVSALPKRIAEIEHKLSDAKAQVEQAKNAIRMQDSRRRQHESEIQSLQSKISKFRDQSLDVKTNEQYKALMHEIQFAEQEIRKNEDKILEIMEGNELLERQVKATESELKTQSAAVEKEKSEARILTEQDEKKLAELKAERLRLREGIGEGALATYDRVARARKTGLAEARSQLCGACHVMLRPQTWNDLKSAEKLITCESCGRILYYDPAHEPPPPPETSKKKAKKKVDTEEVTETEAVTASPESEYPAR